MRTVIKRASGGRSAAGRLVLFLCACALFLSVLAIRAGSVFAPAIGQNGAYRYILEVNTSLATGKENQIQFFNLTYDADPGSGVDLHSKFLFPYDGGGALAEGFAQVRQGTQLGKDREIASTFHYTPAGLPTQPFRTRKRDQYLFTTETPIAQIERIQAFVSATPLSAADYKGTAVTSGGGGSWNCGGIRLFQVQELGEMYRYNAGSPDQYIDFKGTLIGESPAYSYNWNTDMLLTLCSRSGGAVKRNGADPLLTTSFSREYAAREKQDPEQYQLALHFEFADTALGGLEPLSTTPERMPRTLTSLRECMAVTLFYVDRYGMVRQTELPAGIGAALWANRLGIAPSEKIAGIGQQGEGLSVPVFLPDFDSFRPSDRFSVTLGPENAAAVLGCTAESVQTDPGGARLAGLAVYELNGAEPGGGETGGDDEYGEEQSVTVTLDRTSQSVRWDYNGGMKPSWYHVASSTSGELLKSGDTSNISLQTYEGGRLTPKAVKNGDRILVEILTDDVPGAGSRADFLMHLSYRDVNGNMQTLENISIRERAMDFVGYWPGVPQDDRLGYYISMEQGQTLRFFLDISHMQEITDVRIRMADGPSDDWQIRDFSLFRVNSYDRRQIQWEEISVGGLYSDRRIGRYVDAELLYTMNGENRTPTNPEDDSAVPDSGGGSSDGTPGGSSSDGTPGGGSSSDGTPGGGGSDGGTPGGGSSSDGTPGGGDTPGGGSGGGTSGGGSGTTGGLPVLIQQGEEGETVGPGDGESIGVGGGSGNLDWSRLRYSMTYQEASQNLGFLKPLMTYDIAVHVASLDDNTSEENEDCGSKNLFYFRLLFNSGNSSAYVLANQQLAGDAFRTGMVEHFFITTNEDYGDVTAVQIIPEDMSSDSDKFDKLKIDMIEISVAEDAALVPTYTIHNVGWIDIDYHDDAALTAIVGQTGRSPEELTRVYTVDGSSYKANLMVTITTGEQAASQFQGSLEATVYYQKIDGSSGRETVDVVKSMYTFIKAPPNADRTINGKLKSDMSLMFRPHTTDRFLLSVSDVQRISRIELAAYADSNTTWYIDDVSVYLYRGAGRLLLNQYGEYQYFYPDQKDPERLCGGDSTEVPHPYKADFTDASTGAVAKSLITVNLTENEVKLSPETRQWTANISREPLSRNDSLNLILYPEGITQGSSGGAPVAAIQYTTSGADNLEQAALPLTHSLNAAVQNNQPVYYAVNIPVTNMKNLNGILIGTGTTAGFSNIPRAVVQRVRDGVVISTREMAGSGSSDRGIALSDRPVSVRERQRLRFQFGPDTVPAVLSPEVNDLAVCMWFRSIDPAGTEYRTPYVYLTDQDCMSIAPGQIVDLTFDQSNVSAVTGFSFVAAGAVQASVNAAYAETELVSLDTGTAAATGTRSSFSQSLAVTGLPGRLNPTPDTSVDPLTLTFVTSAASESVITGTDGPVRVTLGYYDRNYDLRTRTFSDIRPYFLSGAQTIASGSTEQAEVLVSGVRELRFVEVEPLSQDTDAQTKASWKLHSLSAALNGAAGVERGVGQTIYEGAPVRVALADIQLSASLRTISPQDTDDTGAAETTETTQTTQPTETTETTEPIRLTAGESRDLLLKSGQGVELIPAVEGTDEGFYVTLESLHYESGATGPVSLADTRGYTAAYLQQQAESAASPQERAVWENVPLETGFFSPQITQKLRSDTVIRFTPPRNYTGGVLSYRLRAAAHEASGVAVVVNVIVESETNPVPELLEAARAQAEREAEEARRQAEEAEEAARRQAEEAQARSDTPDSPPDGQTADGDTGGSDSGVDTGYSSGEDSGSSGSGGDSGDSSGAASGGETGD